MLLPLSGKQGPSSERGLVPYNKGAGSTGHTHRSRWRMGGRDLCSAWIPRAMSSRMRCPLQQPARLSGLPKRTVQHKTGGIQTVLPEAKAGKCQTILSAAAQEKRVAGTGRLQMNAMNSCLPCDFS